MKSPLSQVKTDFCKMGYSGIYSDYIRVGDIHKRKIKRRGPLRIQLAFGALFFSLAKPKRNQK